MGEEMNKLITFVLAPAIFISTGWAHSDERNNFEADSVDCDASYLISSSPAGGLAFHSGDQVTITGSIRLVNDFGIESASEKGVVSDQPTLLEKFKKQGIDIVATFPSELADVSSAVQFQSNNPKEIQFTYVTSVIQAQDFNQFSVKLFNNHQEREVLTELSTVRAKLSLRLQALENLKKQTQSTAEEVTDVQAEIAKLGSVITQITAKLDQNQHLLSQNTLALQVDNLTSSESLASLIIDGFRYSISSSIGTAIEGMSPRITGQITNLRVSKPSTGTDHNPKAIESDKKNHLAEFVFNNQIVSSQSAALAPGETVSFQFQAPGLKASIANQFTIDLYSLRGMNKRENEASFSDQILVAADTVAPQWHLSSIPNAKIPFVQNMSAVDLLASDSFGRIDPSSLSVNLSGTTTSGASVNLNLGSLTATSSLDGASFEWTGPGQNLAEGDYTFTANVSDLAGNAATPYQASFTIVRTPPRISLSLGTTGILTNQYQIQIPVDITDVAPVTTTFTVDDPLIYTFSGNHFTATIPLTFEGTNSISIVSQDAAGNVSSPFNFTVIRDTIPPVLTQLLPAMNSVFYTNSLPYTITVSGLSNESLSHVSINGISASLSADRLSYQAQVPIPAGQDMISVIGTDLAGNQTLMLSSVNLIYSTLPPVISLGLSGPIITNRTALNLPITVSDSIPVTTTVWVNGTSVFQTGNTSFMYPLNFAGAGSYVVFVQSIDLAGNLASQLLAVTVDTTPPVITLSSQTTWPSKTGTVTGTLNKKVTSVTINGTAATLDASGTSFSALVTLPGFGNQSLVISAVDLAGNVGTSTVPILVQSGTIAGENPNYGWKYQECSLSGGL
ncbi:MAG: hypothetical protein C5B49_10530 [Bdellovibrio sp.]|nr:MAG: hypothetical protein C5B49_10530 [Bdellovibrio sp.]